MNSFPAALLQGLDPELRARHGHLDREKEIDKVAKDLHVKLVPGLDGLQLASAMPNELDRLDNVVDSARSYYTRQTIEASRYLGRLLICRPPRQPLGCCSVPLCSA